MCHTMGSSSTATAHFPSSWSPPHPAHLLFSLHFMAVCVCVQTFDTSNTFMVLAQTLSVGNSQTPAALCWTHSLQRLIITVSLPVFTPSLTVFSLCASFTFPPFLLFFSSSIPTLIGPRHHSFTSSTMLCSTLLLLLLLLLTTLFLF